MGGNGTLVLVVDFLDTQPPARGSRASEQARDAFDTSRRDPCAGCPYW
jgi:hypothetical protein